MRDRSAALAAARAALDKTPQYKGKNDSDPYMPGQQQSHAPQPLQQSVPPTQSQNPFEQAIMNAAQAQQMQPQAPDQTQFNPPPMGENEYMLMKLYHMLSGISYEMFGDPNKWQETHLEAFFEQIKTAIKRGKSLNSNKMKAMLKKR